MSLRFGTDGVRGVAGTELTPELVLALGRAAARVLGSAGVPFVVGRDTRWSGPLLQAAFSAGVAAEGFDVVDLGVIPTPAVADAALEMSAPAAVVSASHNPFPDNGIKLLSAGGRKLTDQQEERVEAVLASIVQSREDGSGPGAQGTGLGRLRSDPSSVERYLAKVAAALEGRTLAGLRVAVDCANGAASVTAASILERAGAEVVQVLSDQPDGTNINAGCGSTDPGALAGAVRQHHADAGLAFDGDADRVIAVDERGEVVDGDRLLALFAADLHERGRLHGQAVAVTVMTNLGFHQAMAAAGVKVASTPVGDRHILEALEANGWSLGGEQSGHIIFRGVFPSLAPTGDGVLTGLVLLDLLKRRGAPLSTLAAAAMVRMPQVLRNVRVSDHHRLASAAAVWEEVRAVESALGADGRVLLRPSGTEPLVRVMVEAPTEEQAVDAAERLSTVVVEALGAPAS
ncbi:MAG TPA: phosphoglucosamine mutase [Acidimicrobiales bacterium]|nr:phosphoglucosamine mutase [Acidimicrobiales bacterium]